MIINKIRKFWDRFCWLLPLSPSDSVGEYRILGGKDIVYT